MYLGAWRIQKMKKAERLEEMISVFNSFPLNKENFENLLTILNRFMGKSELSWNENKNIEELNNDKNKAF